MELSDISPERFTKIGHKFDDNQLTYEEFIEHEADVLAYLEANK